MITYSSVKKLLEKVRFIESVIRENGGSKKVEMLNEFLIDAKRAYRKELKKLAEQQSSVKFFDVKDSNGEPCGEYWKEMYDIEYDGTKDELIEELNEEAEAMHRDVCACGYDCTGRSFMTGFKVGHIADNKFRVLVGMAIDV